LKIDNPILLNANSKKNQPTLLTSQTIIYYGGSLNSQFRKVTKINRIFQTMRILWRCYFGNWKGK